MAELSQTDYQKTMLMCYGIVKKFKLAVQSKRGGTVTHDITLLQTLRLLI